MAEQLNILQLNGGIPATDPTNAYFYVVIDGVDYPIEYDTLWKNVYRAGDFESTGLENQVVLYSDPFINAKPIIIDPVGTGYDLISWDETGFIITTYGVSDMHYFTIKNR